MSSGDDLEVNLGQVEVMYRRAVTDGAELVVFPENTLFFRISPDAPVREPTVAHVSRLERLVGDLKIPLLLTTATSPRDGKFANATLLFEPGQSVRTVYEKIHLFDIRMRGARAIRESDHYRPGAGSRIIEVAGWRLGLSICYDLRFPELFLKYAQDVDLILVPAAFLMATGRDHWHVLLRARAIESQAFVAAPAQVGAHQSGPHQRETFGHALVVDPWGHVMFDLGDEIGVRVVELRREDVNKMREQIPVADHRRPC